MDAEGDGIVEGEVDKTPDFQTPDLQTLLYILRISNFSILLLILRGVPDEISSD